MAAMKHQKKAVISMASDCSGLGTDVLAGRELHLKVNHLWASDTDEGCRQVLKLFPKELRPKKIYRCFRAAASRPVPDIYTVGFPCQPYSSAGLGKGADDARRSTT